MQIFLVDARLLLNQGCSYINVINEMMDKNIKIKLYKKQIKSRLNKKLTIKINFEIQEFIKNKVEAYDKKRITVVLISYSDYKT